METTADQVMSALRKMRPPLITAEVCLQNLVAERLTQAGIAYERERVLGPRDRIDFLAGDVGIECKKGKPNNTRLVSQLERYCAHPAVGSVILVTPWRRHLCLPERLLDKPVFVLSLNALWGIAL